VLKALKEVLHSLCLGDRLVLLHEFPVDGKTRTKNSGEEQH
jgi:hypothetical protein